MAAELRSVPESVFLSVSQSVLLSVFLSVLLSLQKLSMEGYIRVHYSTDGIQVSFLKHADALSADIDQAVLDLMNLCMKDFTEEEKKMAEDLNRRVYLNLRRSLEEYEQ